MSICISVKVSEGLVLAADSAATITGTVTDPNGASNTGILKTFENARKLSHFKDYPIGTLTWGISQIGSRTVDSLIKEYEYFLPSLEEENQKLKELWVNKKGEKEKRHVYKVQDIAEGLRKYIKTSYDSAFRTFPEQQRPLLGILVSGFSSGEFFPDQWLIQTPFEGSLQKLRPDDKNKPSFGAHWFGMADAIVRLHWGRDDALIPALATRFNVSQDEIKAIVDATQYPIPFEGMPLQDAIDYAIYLVNVVIGRFRFVVGPPVCGGNVDVAVITPSAFRWIKRKLWKA